MRHRALLAAATVLLLAGCRPVDGAAGIGDPYSPDLGNGGYDVLHYAIALDYDLPANYLTGSTSIRARAKQSLRSFSLDFPGMEVDSVEVNSSQASFDRLGRDLRITPARTLLWPFTFSVRVEYHGTPVPSDSTLVSFQVGWFQAEDGSVNVMNVPDGAETWFPANDHPQDKATYRLAISVPGEWYVVGPGSLASVSQEGGRTRYVYEMNRPMTTTSAVLHIDKYEIVEMAPVDGVVPRVFYPEETTDDLKQKFAVLPEALQVLSDAFGPYPFDSYSVVIADPWSLICLGDVLANSEQTVTLQCPSYYGTDSLTTVHELAHEWFGNSVSPASMQDTWLEEGPATYAQWIWRRRDGGLADVDQLARFSEKEYSPQAPIGQPPTDEVASNEVYVGGALLLHALRLRIGEEAFFATLKEFTARYQYGIAGTSDFVEIAEKVSGEDLQSFFQAWLYQVQPPPLPDLPSQS